MPRSRSPSPSSPLKIKIKRFDKSLPLPSYKTSGAVALDLYCRLSVKIQPHQVFYIPLNIALTIPSGFWGLMVPRGSTHKVGIIQANSAGIFDQDYCGDGDEYLFPAYNFTEKTVKINKGTRIAQLLILPLPLLKLIEVDKLNSPNRGGFGTTGK